MCTAVPGRISRRDNTALRTGVALIVSALLLLAAPAARAVVVNEFLAWNWNTNTDEDGEWEDWIELYNTAATPVNLAGYTMTDDPTTPGKWTFPNVWIGGRGYLRVWASNKDRTTVGQPLHTNFRLERSGEFLGLYDPVGAPVDTLTYSGQYEDTSYGRKPDGGATWVFFTSPTPGWSNNTSVSAPGFAADPDFSLEAGIHPGPAAVALSSVTPGAQIRYVQGGAEPTEASPVYTTPLSITTPTVIRAQTYVPGLFPSKVVTKTYIVNFTSSMPVISVVTDPANLWGASGIYYANVSGPAGERPCHIEYWEPDGTSSFTLPCGLRIHGGASKSRDDIHKKSFRLHFRRVRGPTKLEYPLYDTTSVDRFNQIVLRANYNDSWCHHQESQRTNALMIRDELTRVLRLEMGDLACHGLHANLFLNGRRWGIYNITERMEGDFLESYLDHEDWDILDLGGVVKEGNSSAWNSFYGWIASADLTVDSNYQQARTWMDLENYTNYMILNFWQANTDWPHHNGYMYRARGLPGAKWRFLDWDTEYGWNNAKGAPVSINMWSNRTGARLMVILSRLTTNPDYRIYYAQRSDILFNTVLEEAHQIQRMDEQAAKIREAIPFEGVMPGLYRGRDSNLPPYTYTQGDWDAALQAARNWTNVRMQYVRRHVRDRFPEVTGWGNLTLLPPQGGEGDVLLHQVIRPPSYPWTGTFYQGVPLSLHAEPRTGYAFIGWSDPSLSTTDTVQVVPGAGVPSGYSVYAIFGPDTSAPTLDDVVFVTRKRMVVVFNKAVKPASAQTASNYALDNGVGSPVSAVSLTTSSVLLEFAGNLSEGTDYRLSVTQVEPVVGTPIPLHAPATGRDSFVIPPVVISEVMYNCHGPDYEWIELHNTTGAAMDVSGWYLTDDSVYPAVGEGNWTLPAGTVIPVDGYVVVTLDRDMSAWRFPRDVARVEAIINNGGNLNNGGDNLALYDRASGGTLIDGSLVDCYPDEATAGHSLEKEDDAFPWRAHPAAWRAAFTPLGWYTPAASYATPGRANGVGWKSAVRYWPLY